MSVVIPNGYKQTKVGVVPEDWEEFQLKDILNLTLESLKMEDEKEYELITVRRRFGGVDSRGLFKGKEILVKNQFYVRENDFVISKRQISHGACGLVPIELDGAIVSNEYNVFKPNKNLLNQEFFNYYVRLPKFSQTFYNYSDGVHIEKLLFKTQSWLKQKIPFPPLKEQQKIAQILTTWDEAISKQEQLITTKERLKKGLMQKLLSGEIRFAGFDGEWEEVKLGDIGEFKTSSVNKIIDENEQIVNLINYMDVYRNKHIDKNFKCSSTSVKKESFGKVSLKKGDILFTPSSETPDDIGHSSVIVEDLPNTVYSYHLIRFRPKKNLDIGFSGYVFNNATILKEFARRATGSTRFTLSIKDFNEINANLPSIQEQQKIAQVLISTDKEIELLKEELETLKEQKRGLMQGLLSGGVRVKIDEGVENG